MKQIPPNLWSWPGQLLVVLGLLLASGCGSLRDIEGRPLSLVGYDSVVIDRFDVAEGVEADSFIPFCRLLIEAALLRSEIWAKGNNPDFLGFAHSRNIQLPPGAAEAMQQAEPWADYPEDPNAPPYVNDYLRLLKKPPGTNPVQVRLRIMELAYSTRAQQFLFGVPDQVKVRMDLYEPSGEQHIGGANLHVVSGHGPGGWLVGGPLQGLIMLNHSSGLANELAKKVISELNAAKKRR